MTLQVTQDYSANTVCSGLSYMILTPTLQADMFLLFSLVSNFQHQKLARKQGTAESNMVASDNVTLVNVFLCLTSASFKHSTN